MATQIRKEYFGYTVLDHSTLKHHFLRNGEEDQLPNGAIFLPFKRDDYRHDLLYSPIRVYYEATLRCNLHCRYCFNDSGEPRRVEMTSEEQLLTLGKLREANVMDVRFTGGEFTTRPDWFRLFSRAKELGFCVSCNTNGVYNKKVWDQLADLKLDQITISLDGLRENHERNRGKGTFEPTVRTIKELHKRGAITRINTLLTAGTIQDIPSLTELASHYTSEFHPFTVRFFGRGQEYEATEAIPLEQVNQVRETMQELKAKYPNLNIILPDMPTFENTANDNLNQQLGLTKCAPDGTTRFNISSDGRLWPGGYLPYIDEETSVGNILTDDLFEVWQYGEKMAQFRKGSRAIIELCEKCPIHLTKCLGANYERELFRLKNPDRDNSYCIKGKGPSLLIQSGFTPTRPIP